MTGGHRELPGLGRVKPLLRASVNALPYGMRRAIRFIPGFAAGQRWLVNRVMNGETFVHAINAGPASGLQFEVSLPSDKAVWAGTYEAEFARELSRSVTRGDVCYDVGGYRGYMSAVMALAGASKVIVFEPLPVNRKALKRLCELNPKLPIEIRPFAIADGDGTGRLRVLADTSMAKLASSPFQNNAVSGREISIDIRRIDTLVAAQECLPPNIIKIDVEGAELDVLRGARAVLDRYRPAVFLEAHSDEL
ncbi:MAG: FkbM family methyltransferase, partial [Xanthobacteraceae bacterium]